MKKIGLTLIIGIVLGLFIRDLFFDHPASAKIVTVKSRNLTYQTETTDKSLSHGMTINLNPAVEVTIDDGGQRRTIHTDAESVGDLLWEQQISLASTDRVNVTLEGARQKDITRDELRQKDVTLEGRSPDRVSRDSIAQPAASLQNDMGTFLTNGMEIRIDRIVDLEVVEDSEIPFAIERINHAVLPYGTEQKLQKGSPGKKQEEFLITYKNGVEIARKLLSTEIIKAPVNEKILFGTDVKIQETRQGRASWYAWQACICAAHPFYEKGRYVRVTNTETGKSIIVRINDRGPDLSVHPDRVIDLDSVAYKELAPLGTGTIPVKVELIKN